MDRDLYRSNKPIAANSPFMAAIPSTNDLLSEHRLLNSSTSSSKSSNNVNLAAALLSVFSILSVAILGVAIFQCVKSSKKKFNKKQDFAEQRNKYARGLPFLYLPEDDEDGHHMAELTATESNDSTSSSSTCDRDFAIERFVDEEEGKLYGESILQVEEGREDVDQHHHNSALDSSEASETQTIDQNEGSTAFHKKFSISIETSDSNADNTASPFDDWPRKSKYSSLLARARLDILPKAGPIPQIVKQQQRANAINCSAPSSTTEPSSPEIPSQDDINIKVATATAAAILGMTSTCSEVISSGGGDVFCYSPSSDLNSCCVDDEDVVAAIQSRLAQPRKVDTRNLPSSWSAVSSASDFYDSKENVQKSISEALHVLGLVDESMIKRILSSFPSKEEAEIAAAKARRALGMTSSFSHAENNKYIKHAMDQGSIVDDETGYVFSTKATAERSIHRARRALLLSHPAIVASDLPSVDRASAEAVVRLARFSLFRYSKVGPDRDLSVNENQFYLSGDDDDDDDDIQQSESIPHQIQDPGADKDAPSNSNLVQLAAAVATGAANLAGLIRARRGAGLTSGESGEDSRVVSAGRKRFNIPLGLERPWVSRMKKNQGNECYDIETANKVVKTKYSVAKDSSIEVRAVFDGDDASSISTTTESSHGSNPSDRKDQEKGDGVTEESGVCKIQFVRTREIKEGTKSATVEVRYCASENCPTCRKRTQESPQYQAPTLRNNHAPSGEWHLNPLSLLTSSSSSSLSSRTIQWWDGYNKGTTSGDLEENKVQLPRESLVSTRYQKSKSNFGLQ